MRGHVTTASESLPTTDRGNSDSAGAATIGPAHHCRIWNDSIGRTFGDGNSMSTPTTRIENSCVILKGKDSWKDRISRNAKVFACFSLVVFVACSVSSLDRPSPASLSQLWESDDSPNHDPYFNVFDDGVDNNPKENHRHWTSEDVREKVWQTLKDVEAMENHVEEQNALNYKLKQEIAYLDEGITKEQEIIRLLIEEGISHVDGRLNLIREAVATNVSAVKKTLRILKAEDQAKQRQQDIAIHQLNARHKALAAATASQLQRVSPDFNIHTTFIR